MSKRQLATLAPSACVAAALMVVGASVSAQASVIGHSPVLGARSFEPDGVGWGTYRPREVFNGGDPSGRVIAIKWTGWGTSLAIGYGKTSIFKPGGGYYPGLVRAELRATALGHCARGGPLAYTHLAAREPARPGGPLGRWFSWSGAKTIC